MEREALGARLGVVVPNGFPGIPTYRLPASLSPRPGARVAVPFGNRVVTGIAVEGEPEPLAAGNEREVLAVLDDEPFLPPALLSVLLRAAAYYFVPPGELLRAAVPGRLLSLGETVYRPAREMVGRSPDTDRAREVLGAVVARGQATLAGLAQEVGAASLGRTLRQLLEEGFVRVADESVRGGRSPVERAWIARPHPSADLLLARRPKQRDLYRHLSSLGRPASAVELRAAGHSPALLPALGKEGLAAPVETERRTDLSVHAGRAAAPPAVVPTSEQRAALDAIGAAVRAGREATFLLDGVTGSGKTEVYLGAAEATRDQGKQSILLVPEIALAPALVRRVLARFGDRVSLLHSGLSDGERASEWERARRGDVDAVVGPRSAIFAPLPRLGHPQPDTSELRRAHPHPHIQFHRLAQPDGQSRPQALRGDQSRFVRRQVRRESRTVLARPVL